mgnify:CR=1 FL=1
MITCFALLVNRIYRFFKVNGIFFTKAPWFADSERSRCRTGYEPVGKSRIFRRYIKKIPLRRFYDATGGSVCISTYFAARQKADAAARRFFKTKRLDNTTSIAAEILKPCASLKLHTRCFFNLKSRFNCS